MDELAQSSLQMLGFNNGPVARAFRHQPIFAQLVESLTLPRAKGDRAVPGNSDLDRRALLAPRICTRPSRRGPEGRS